MKTDLRDQADEWMSQLASGDDSRFCELYKAYNRRLIGYVRRRISEQEVGDVVQDVWTSVVTHSKMYICDRTFESWLMRMARNRVISKWRKTQRKLQHSEMDNPDELTDRWALATGDGIDRMIQAEDVHAVESAIETLSPEQQQVVSLWVFAGLTLAEIAESLSIPLGTAKGRLRSAKSKIKAELGLVVRAGEENGSEKHNKIFY